MGSFFRDFDLIIFDADGTLFDTVYFYVETYHAIYKQYGLFIPRAHIHKYIGMGSDKALKRLCPPEWLEKHAQDVAREGVRYYLQHYLPQVEAFPCTVELLDLLRKAGKRTALATMSGNDVVAQYVSLVGGKERFDCVSTSSTVARSKPDPDIFLQVLSQFPQIKANRVCVVGDSVWDMLAARTAGMTPVGVLSGGYASQELIEAGAVDVFKDVEALYRSAS